MLLADTGALATPDAVALVDGGRDTTYAELDRMSAQASGWHDVVPVGRELYAAAPDRCLFGTDWPHTHSHNEGGGPQESELIELLYRFLPDPEARQAVLVDNPARLHGFGEVGE